MPTQGTRDGYAATSDPDHDLDLARAADLFALVDLAARDHDPARRNSVTTVGGFVTALVLCKFAVPRHAQQQTRREPALTVADPARFHSRR